MLTVLVDVSYKPGKQLQIARLLLGGPKTLTELAQHIDADPSGLLRLLRRMERRGQVSFQSSGHSKAGRGRVSGLWFLPDLARDSLASVDEGRVVGVGPVSMQQHQSWVLVNVRTHDLPDLMEIFASAPSLAGADWIAQLQGDSRGYLVVFPEEVGTQPADSLSVALRAARMPCSSGVVAQLKSPEQFVANARGVAAVYRQALEAKQSSEGDE